MEVCIPDLYSLEGEDYMGLDSYYHNNTTIFAVYNVLWHTLGYHLPFINYMGLDAHYHTNTIFAL